MAHFEGLDIGLAGMTPMDKLVPQAKAAEAAGFDRIWISEGYYGMGAFSNLAVLARETSHVEMASGIVSPFTRHPSILAMESANLDLLSGGRFVLGLGAARGMLRRHGWQDAKAIGALRDSIEIVRGLFSGQPSAYDGSVFSVPAPGISLMMKPQRRDLPIAIGSMGRLTLRMAAGLADCILLNFFLTPAFMADVMPFINDGASAAGRNPDDLDLRSYLIVSVDRDAKAARDAARALIATYAYARASEPRRYYFAGIDDEEIEEVRGRIAARFDAGERPKGIAEVGDDWVEKLSLSGTPDEVCERLIPYAEHGLKRPCIYGVIGPDVLQSIQLIKDEIMPKLL